MSDKNLELAVKTFLDVELEEAFGVPAGEAPKRHREQTPACPPLWRFPTGVGKGWNEDEREHVTGCSYCQKVTATQWRLECPGLFALVRFLAQGEAFEDAAAMRIHLDQDRDRRCALLLQSVSVRKLAAVMKAGRRTAEELKALADQAAFTYVLLPEVAAAGSRCEPSQDVERFEAWAESADKSGLAVTLSETPSGTLEVSVDAPLALKAAQVEILGATPQNLELELRQYGQRGTAVWPLGPFSNQVRMLGRDCLLLTAPSIEDL